MRRIWLFSANKIKSSESVSKQPTQLIIATEIRHNCNQYNHYLDYLDCLDKKGTNKMHDICDKITKWWNWQKIEQMTKKNGNTVIVHHNQFIYSDDCCCWSVSVFSCFVYKQFINNHSRPPGSVVVITISIQRCKKGNRVKREIL